MDRATHCSGCGLVLGECLTAGRCRRPFEPARFCPLCGRRLRVLVTPASWSATCRQHGLVDEDRPDP
ncbi:MAG TPA: hypothetical protein VKY15_04560 [Acidimicrobiales bacterium]|nr:hypothetical protein [Acidimicrobiales bacterium]